ncbi:MAG: DUF4445 domain-containing protein [Eubacterium sp.]|nr:DUF4445 domain-containing protein [Eubacterium sp.]
MRKKLKPKYINDTALDILRREGIFLCADCGGRGTCGKCRIKVHESGKVTDEEHKILSDREIAQEVRLACRVRISEIPGAESGIEVEIPERSLLYDVPADVQVIKPEPLGLSEIIAVDYGTTVINGAVVDLNNGIVREASVLNHQKAYGADVISRIRAANDGYNEELRHVSEDDLAELSVRLGKDPDRARYIISGNTVMGHLISGFSCRGLGEYPYTPVDISLRRDGSITFLPGISAFVGADIVSGICACSLDQAPEPWLYVDIGTNGEMVLGTGERIFAASAPAGPAFEGGGLSCGVPAIPGAVSGVVITGSKAIPSVIGRSSDVPAEDIDGEESSLPVKPSGICGSGIIDVIAELLRNRLIDENGTIAAEYAEEGFQIAGDVMVTQKDIREVQKAKAAIRAGMETLIAKSGLKAGDIRKLVVAGSFGSSINMDNASKIGLIPEELLPVSATAGNASLAGATLYSLDTGFGVRLTKLAGSAETVELSETPEFGAKYISYMGF